VTPFKLSLGGNESASKDVVISSSVARPRPSSTRRACWSRKNESDYSSRISVHCFLLRRDMTRLSRHEASARQNRAGEGRYDFAVGMHKVPKVAASSHCMTLWATLTLARRVGGVTKPASTSTGTASVDRAHTPILLVIFMLAHEEKMACEDDTVFSASQHSSERDGRLFVRQGRGSQGLARVC